MLSRTLPTQVADHIRERILSGELAPGERIIETDLAAEFEVSRHTLRSALQTLTHEGLLEQSQFKSTHVTRPTADDVFEIYTLRNALEAMACRLAAQRAGDTTGMDAAVTRMRNAAQAGDTPAMKVADFDFHTAVIELAGHTRLREHYRALHAQTRLYLNLTATVGYELDEIAAKHAELADAIRTGDAARAEQLGGGHNTADGERLVALLTAPAPQG
ncbi:GntR family transcriptional regulator [Solirubrobacter phytolaccae]|uniref:GntR family transcriptional regulator n=1 Tax=Solirubrobacter phytolaccae TaxID=1404360 RepID=A0A9X3NJM9_9ACTN|nr:GntR family transcriptional regulator [Solirubrobacter phytolaccae]MDA0182592.1 GntR family transcriptional regulator [Solirubrobacter phytolaccae]